MYVFYRDLGTSIRHPSSASMINAWWEHHAQPDLLSPCKSTRIKKGSQTIDRRSDSRCLWTHLLSKKKYQVNPIVFTISEFVELVPYFR
jgi:hypothetical protein